MPELAEVEFYRKRWQAGQGAEVISVGVHPGKRIFRDCPASRVRRQLTGTRLLGSWAAAKQMLFHFSGHHWLGLHLGMSGELRVESPDYRATPHDHLVLRQRERQLVFNDPRMFGSVKLQTGPDAPKWWTQIAPPILSRAFTVGSMVAFLRRRSRAPIKAVLLMQEKFPGIGNWMADEILWRAAIHPGRRAGSLTRTETTRLFRACRKVCQLALVTIAGKGRHLPPALNQHIPKSWLFWHRWEDGGRCPRSGQPLRRAIIGGRTTCWSPSRQRPN